jgi:hypothetical protein
VVQCRMMRYSFQAGYPTRSQQSLKQPDRGTCPRVRGKQCRPRRSEVKQGILDDRRALDRHCSGQEKCLAEGRQLQRDGWPGSVGVQLARWCGWWRGEQGQQQQRREQQQQRGSPWSVVEPWLVAHARAVGCGGGGPLAGSADGTGRREESSLAGGGGDGRDKGGYTVVVVEVVQTAVVVNVCGQAGEVRSVTRLLSLARHSRCSLRAAAGESSKVRSACSSPPASTPGLWAVTSPKAALPARQATTLSLDLYRYVCICRHMERSASPPGPPAPTPTTATRCESCPLPANRRRQHHRRPAITRER